MSLTSYRAAPPRVGDGVMGRSVGWKTWRRPTLPCLEAQYHGRWGFSRPSSGWDRVRAPRQSHQVVQPADSGPVTGRRAFWSDEPVLVRGCVCVMACRQLIAGRRRMTAVHGG